MIAGARHLAAVLTWKPFGATAVATSAWLTLTGRPSLLLLSMAATAVAATTPFVLDDSAAATMHASPATLLRRRLHRTAMMVPVLGAWWALAVTIVSRSTAGVPLAEYTLQLVTIVAIGLAGASTAAKFGGDRARAGTAGSLAVIVCAGTAFLPLRSLQLVPNDPAAPDAARRLMVVLVVAVVIHLATSADPARRMVVRRATAVR
jgi:hypothetical protein